MLFVSPYLTKSLFGRIQTLNLSWQIFYVEKLDVLYNIQLPRNRSENNMEFRWWLISERVLVSTTKFTVWQNSSMNLHEPSQQNVEHGRLSVKRVEGIDWLSWVVGSIEYLGHSLLQYSVWSGTLEKGGFLLLQCLGM